MNPKTKALNKVKEPPTPFKLIGSGTKSRVKSIGKVLDKQFIEPSRKVNALRDAKMKAMDLKAKSGEFN